MVGLKVAMHITQEIRSRNLNKLHLNWKLSTKLDVYKQFFFRINFLQRRVIKTLLVSVEHVRHVLFK